MPQGPLAIGRLGKQNELQIAERYGMYYTGAYSGLTAFAANQSGKTTSAGLATTYTGLCVSNPAASTVNLAIQSVRGAFNVATTAITTIGLITGWTAAGIVTHTTPLTPYSTKVGTVITTPIIQGLADSACTLVGTPVWSSILATSDTTVVAGSLFNTNLNGEFIIPPGGYIAIGTTIASGAAGLFGFISWQEVPI